MCIPMIDMSKWQQIAKEKINERPATQGRLAGTNANGLTKAQRARIGIGTGEDVYISAKGWLTLTPPGMFIAIQ